MIVIKASSFCGLYVTALLHFVMYINVSYKTGTIMEERLHDETDIR